MCNIKYSSVFRIDQALIACLYHGTIMGKTHYDRMEIEHFFQTVQKAMKRDAEEKTAATGIKHEMICETTFDEDVKKHAHFITYSRALDLAASCHFSVVSESFIKDNVDSYFGKKKEMYDNSFFKLLGMPFRPGASCFKLPDDEDYYIKTNLKVMNNNWDLNNITGLILKYYVDLNNQDPKIKKMDRLLEMMDVPPFDTEKIENGAEILANTKRIIQEEAVIFAGRFLKPKKIEQKIADKYQQLQFNLEM